MNYVSPEVDNGLFADFAEFLEGPKIVKTSITYTNFKAKKLTQKSIFNQNLYR